MKEDVIIINYGVGNIGSVINMLKRIGVSAKLSSLKEDIISAKKLILPGVGAFDKGMTSLAQSGLIPTLCDQVLEVKKPILGICLGMQLLLDASQEGIEKGLGWIPGESLKFDAIKHSIKVPHMGWNIVKPINTATLFNGLDESRFYFVHSYRVVCQNADNCLATCQYGEEFVSAVHKENIFGVQFHPEKSHKYGMKLLKNFVELPC